MKSDASYDNMDTKHADRQTPIKERQVASVHTSGNQINSIAGYGQNKKKQDGSNSVHANLAGYKDN